LPDGLSVAATPDPNYPYDEADGLYNEPTPEEVADEFEDQLIDAMTTPIRDEDSASAVVPLIIRGPADLGDKIKQFKFERSFDPALAQRADRVLERILQGIDVPKDVVTGLANVKYSNAVQIDESLYKAHIEPLMLLLADAFTVVYLRPYLLANGFDKTDVDRVCAWYDPSQVATRNDRAMDADNGFDRMAVSYDTWRRAHGFSEADAPSPTELALRMIIEKGMITPELTEAMLNAVAPEVMAATRAASQAQSVAPIPPEMAQALQGMQPAAAPAEEAPAPAEEPAAAPAAEAPQEPPVALAEPQ
jgi:cell division septation protein DedD